MSITKSQTNAKFLHIIGERAKNDILDAVARHYGISRIEAREEVVDEEAESILEYLTGAERAAASLLAKRNGLFAEMMA